MNENANRGNCSETTLTGIVWSLGLVMLFLLLLAVPIENVRVAVSTEWQRSTEVFGSWAVELTKQIYDSFGIERLVHELIRISGADYPKYDVEVTLAHWIIGRVEVLQQLLVIALLRLVTLFGWAAIFSPAFVITLFCGWLRREENKEKYFFTSPYKATKWSCGIKLCLMGLVTIVLSPIAVNSCVTPLLLFLLVFLSEKFMSGLQKEI